LFQGALERIEENDGFGVQLVAMDLKSLNHT
jgi:hypothetical protein